MNKVFSRKSKQEYSRIYVPKIPTNDNNLPIIETIKIDNGLKAVLKSDEKSIRGSSAEIYSCDYNENPAKVKIFRNDLIGKHEERIYLKIKESNLPQHQSPAIEFLGQGEYRKSYCLFFSKYDATLYDLLHDNETQLDITCRYNFAKSIAIQVERLHSMGIVHGDLRCGNIMVTSLDSRTVKLFDFETSRIVKKGSKIKTPTPPVRWCAPEVLKKEPITYQSDVYSYGMTIHELFSKMTPWNKSDDFSVREDILIDKRPPQVYDTHDPELEKLISDCWDPNPNKRPEFKEIKQRLDEMIEKLKPAPSAVRNSLPISRKKKVTVFIEKRNETKEVQLNVKDIEDLKYKVKGFENSFDVQFLRVSYYDNTVNKWLEADIIEENRKYHVYPSCGDSLKSYDSSSSYSSLKSEKWNSSKECLLADVIITDKKIGQGHFGEIYMATHLQAEIVVKKLKKDDDTLENEIFFLRKLNYLHILHYYGICSIENELYMCIEYMSLGDLKEFLKAQPENSFPLTNLIEMARAASLAVEYLQNFRTIHRDLAARNFLVTKQNDGFLVKLGDFGLAYALENNEETVFLNGENPVRWTAIESLLSNGKFSLESDLWSLGVVLWEIFNFGQNPYFWITTNEQVLLYIQSGDRLNQPDKCPDSIFKVMLELWDSNPSSRPTAKKVSEFIGTEKEKLDGFKIIENGLLEIVEDNDYSLAN